MNCTEAAAKAGDIQSLQQLMLSPDFQWDPDTTAFAAEYGQLEFLKFAYEHGCPWGDHTCSSAAERGHLDCLKFAHEHGALLLVGTPFFALSGGNLECLKYACEKGCPVNEIHSSKAACRSLEYLQYLHGIRCPMDVYTSIYAARNFRLDCLRFALETGCPFERGTCVSLNKHTDKIDLDQHIWLRNQLFLLMESGVLIQRDDCKDLYNKVQAKIEEIRFHRQFAMTQCNELPSELVNFIICEYF
jgi:hypothetical protein